MTRDKLEIFGIPNWLLKTDNSVNEVSSPDAPRGNVSATKEIAKKNPRSHAPRGNASTSKETAPRSHASRGNVSKVVFCLVVEKKNEQSFLEKGATQDLLFKMLGAIGLTPTDIHCIAVADETDLKQQLKNIQAKKLLLMGDFQSNKDAFITPHPSEILQKPELKRIAWEELKQLENKNG